MSTFYDRDARNKTISKLQFKRHYLEVLESKIFINSEFFYFFCYEFKNLILNPTSIHCSQRKVECRHEKYNKFS